MWFRLYTCVFRLVIFAEAGTMSPPPKYVGCKYNPSKNLTSKSYAHGSIKLVPVVVVSSRVLTFRWARERTQRSQIKRSSVSVFPVSLTDGRLYRTKRNGGRQCRFSSASCPIANLRTNFPARSAWRSSGHVYWVFGSFSSSLCAPFSDGRRTARHFCSSLRAAFLIADE